MTPVHGRERYRSIVRSLRRLRYLVGYALPRSIADAMTLREPAYVRAESQSGEKPRRIPAE